MGLPRIPLATSVTPWLAGAAAVLFMRGFSAANSKVMNHSTLLSSLNASRT